MVWRDDSGSKGTHCSRRELQLRVPAHLLEFLRDLTPLDSPGIYSDIQIPNTHTDKLTYILKHTHTV